MGPIKLLERKAVKYETVEIEYTSEDIRAIFGDDETSLVIALLDRLEATQKELHDLAEAATDFIYKNECCSDDGRNWLHEDLCQYSLFDSEGRGTCREDYISGCCSCLCSIEKEKENAI